MARQAGALSGQLVLPDMAAEMDRPNDPRAGMPLSIRQCMKIEEYYRHNPGPRCPAQARNGRHLVIAPMPTDARPQKMPQPPTPYEQFGR
jgi:hypothetical protein